MMQTPLEKTPTNLAVARENLKKIRAFAEFYVALAVAFATSQNCASYRPSTGQMRGIGEPNGLRTTLRYKTDIYRRSNAEN